MGHCLSANKVGATGSQPVQNQAELLECEGFANQERIVSETKQSDEYEVEGKICREITLSVPRSQREPWKSFLERDYWNGIFAKQKKKRENSEFFQNLCSFSKGDFCTLPVEHPKVFAIFVSSTFTDTEVERNLLIEDVQPYLREVCSLFGYEFRFCEMRWGVREEASEDHQIVNLCLQELKRCQTDSCGINFITLLCDKYGYCPFPSSIPKEEFDELLSYIDEDECKTLLLKWFKKDENMVKSEYVLQKISSVIYEYNDDDDDSKKKQARNQWWSEFETMQNSLKAASLKLADIDRRKYYEMSVTELEVLKGVIEADFPEKAAFMIKRSILNMEEKCEEEGAGKYIDIDWSSKIVNQESRKRLLLLKNEKVPKVLNDQNIKAYDIEWSINGVNRDSHQNYLQDVTDTICHKVFDSIKEHFIQRTMLSHLKDSAEYRLEKELRQGAMFMKKLSKSAMPRDNLLNVINNYIFSASSNTVCLLSPLIISGKSGSGKSTLMTLSIMQTMSELRSCDNSSVIFRFIGTTPESGETTRLLSSLLHQFSVVNGATSLSDRENENAELVAKRFRQEIKEEKRRTVIFLDALDQLSDVDIITEMEWLPASLPQNVKLIISCTPSKSNVPTAYFQYLKSIINTNNFISVEQFDAKMCGKLLNQWLNEDDRVLSHTQMEVLRSACLRCPLPLFLKVAYDETRIWHSYDEVTCHPLNSAMCIKDLVFQLYGRLAITHGKLLFERGIAYFTAAKDGLSRQELEDILSCDDDVLNDIFQWWVPPIRRIPQLQVVRLISDLETYLTETDSFSDGVPLLRWFHRQFNEATVALMEKAVDMKEIHRHMANYFGGSWSTTGKPYTDKKDSNKEVYADRKVPRNPLVIEGKLIKGKKEAEKDMSFVAGSDCKLNLRRINEHCYHLIKGEMLENAANVLCNLDYIHSKMKEKKQNNLLEELSMLLNKLQEYESNATLKKVEEFSSFILQKGNVMAQFPSLTYQEAANYLAGSSVRDAYKNMQEKPSFVLRTSLQNNDHRLVSVIKGHKESIISVCLQRALKQKRSNLMATGSLDGKIKIWFYNSGMEKGSFKGHSKGVNFIDFVDDSLLAISSDGRMVLWDAESFTEELVFTASDDPDVIIPGNCCKFVNDTKWMVSAWDDGTVRVGNIEGNWILKSDSRQHPVTCINIIDKDEIVAGYADGEVVSYKIINSPCEEFRVSNDFGINDELVEVFDVHHHNQIYIIIGKQKAIRTQYTEDSNSEWAKNCFKNDSYVQKLMDGGMELTEAIGKKMEDDMSSIGSFVLLRNKDGPSFKYVLKGLPTPHEYICADLKFPYLVTGGSNGSVRIWIINHNFSSNELSVLLVKELGFHCLEVNRVCFVSNGCRVVSVSDDMDIKLWNAESVAEDNNTRNVSQTSYKIAGCRTEGNFVVTWGKRGLVSAWRAEKLLWTKICCSGEDITSVGIAPKGAKIMIGGQNYYELLNGETGSTYDIKRSCVGRRIRICDFSMDGTTALLGDNCDIRLVVVEPQMEPLGFNDVTWKAHDDHVNSAQFCSHLYYIASGSFDGSIKLWDNSQECCIVVELGIPILSFVYISSLSKMACILDGDDSLDLQVSYEKYPLDESTSSDILKKSNEIENDDKIIETRPFMQSNSMDNTLEDSRRWEEGNQFKLSNISTESCLPKFQDNINVNEDFLLPMKHDVQPGDPFDGFEMPAMSKEMLQNLEKLQAMFMNASERTECSPPHVPSHQVGPHRLLKKEKRQIQYFERKEIGSTTITLLDINLDKTTESKVIFKETKPGLNGCVLSKDCQTLYSSSCIGQVFVWRHLDDKWYDIARYVNEDDSFVTEIVEQSNQILVASKYTIQKLDVISN